MPKEGIGLSTLDCARLVIEKNSEISSLTVRRYLPNSGPIHGYDEQKIPILRSGFLSNFDPNSLIPEGDTESNVALDAPVILNQSESGYLIMLDFYIPKSDSNLQFIKDKFGEQITPRFGGGYILETRNSYHYLGMNVTNQDGWLDFLGLCLLTSSPVVGEDGVTRFVEVPDTRYIGYSLLRRSSGIRLTSRGQKSFTPHCVSILG